MNILPRHLRKTRLAETTARADGLHSRPHNSRPDLVPEPLICLHKSSDASLDPVTDAVCTAIYARFAAFRPRISFFSGARLCTFVARLCQNSQRRQTTSGSPAYPATTTLAHWPNSLRLFPILSKISTNCRTITMRSLLDSPNQLPVRAKKPTYPKFDISPINS